MTTAAPAKVRPWGIEADHPRNCDLLIQSIPGCRLRGAVAAHKPVVDARTGATSIPIDQMRHLGMLPRIPGMQLHVFPDKLRYEIVDPLHGDEELCQKIEQGLRADGRFFGSVRGVRPSDGTLDQDRMKTLCREMWRLVELGHAKVVRGSRPSMEEIDAMPGEYLLNPGSRIQNSQPKYEKDYDEWVRRLNQLGL